MWIDILRAGLSRKLPQDKVSGHQSGRRKANFDILLPFLKRHWKKGAVGVAVIFTLTLLVFPTPLINRFLVDKVILEKNMQWLVWTVLAIGGVQGLSMLLSMLQQYTFGRFQLDVALDLQKTLLDHTLRLPKAFFDDKEIGYLLSRVVSDVQGLNWFFSQTVVSIFTNFIRFIGGTIFLFILEWRLTLAILVVLPLLVLCVDIFSKRLRILSYHGMEQQANVYSRFQETLSSIPLIKAFVSEKHESSRVIQQVQISQQISMEQTVVNSVANSVINLVPSIAKAVVLLAGAYWVIRGDWTLGSLFAFQSYMGYVYGPALSLAGINLQLQNALVTLDRVSALLDVIPEDASGKGKCIDHLKGDVLFSHVAFSYDKTEIILEDITFHVHPGEHIAIVGPSGVGKTTLISLLLRFYLPVDGEIKYDELEASEYDLNSLRKRIGYVSQSNLLMAGTIRENLCYGDHDVTQEELIKATKVAGIYDFILCQPNQFETLVGEKGVNFSEGQKQRISIARALTKDPDILILDEPTSALDNLTEKNIFSLLPNEVRTKTLFIVAHRLSTIMEADRIMILKDKRILDFNTHQHLIENNLYYQSLFS